MEGDLWLGTVESSAESVRRLDRQLIMFMSNMLSNVRSLSNKLDEVEQRLTRPDVAVLTETWLDEDVPDNSISVSHYCIVRKDRNRYGGGLIFYISNRFLFQIIDDQCVSSLASCGSEILPVIFLP